MQIGKSTVQNAQCGHDQARFKHMTLREARMGSTCMFVTLLLADKLRESFEYQVQPRSLRSPLPLNPTTCTGAKLLAFELLPSCPLGFPPQQ